MVSNRRVSLTGLRRVFAGSLVAMALVVVLTWFVSREGSTDAPTMSPRTFLILLAAYGALDLVLVRAALRRTPPQTATVEAVGDWFRALTLLGHSLGMSSFLLGFVGVFLANEWTLVLAGVPVALIVLWLVAPTARRVANAQRRLNSAGVAVELTDAVEVSPQAAGGLAR